MSGNAARAATSRSRARGWLAASAVVAVAVAACSELRVASLDAGAEDGGADASPDANDACRGAGCTPVVLAADRKAPADLSVQGSFVYWVEQGTAENGTRDGTLSRASTTCDAGPSCVEDLATDGVSFAGLAVDKTSVYVAQGTLATGQVQRLMLPDGKLTAFATPELGARRVAVDDVAAYWVNAGSAPGEGAIRRKFLDATVGAGITIAGSLDYPAAVAVKNGRVYFSVRSQTDTDGTIQACDVTGASPTTIASAQSQPRGVAVDGNYVYWVNRGDGTVRRARPTGAEATVLVPNGTSPNAVAVDADGIYWTEAGSDPDRLDGRVRAAKLDGTSVVTLVEPLPEPIAIAVDAAGIYVAVRGTSSNGYRDGRILKLAKP